MSENLEEVCTCGHERGEHIHTIGEEGTVWEGSHRWDGCRRCASKPKRQQCRFFKPMDVDELHRLAGIEKPHQEADRYEQTEFNFGRE